MAHCSYYSRIDSLGDIPRTDSWFVQKLPLTRNLQLTNPTDIILLHRVQTTSPLDHGTDSSQANVAGGCEDVGESCGVLGATLIVLTGSQNVPHVLYYLSEAHVLEKHFGVGSRVAPQDWFEKPNNCQIS